MRFSAFRSVFRFHVKRAPRKIVSHETYSLSLIFLPIFLHLRRYPPACMKTDRTAPLQQSDLAHVCAVFSPLFSPGFSCTPLKTALILPPESLPSDVFLARHPLPGHRAAPGSHPNTPSCCNIRLYDRPRASPSLSANQSPAVLLRRSDFGEFCIVSHETSAFSMFSTCLILLCFCPILIAFWRDLERKTRFLPAFPSHDRSPTFVLARRR